MLCWTIFVSTMSTVVRVPCLVFGHEELRYRASPVLYVDRVDGGGVNPHQALAWLPDWERPAHDTDSF